MLVFLAGLEAYCSKCSRVKRLYWSVALHSPLPLLVSQALPVSTLEVDSRLLEDIVPILLRVLGLGVDMVVAVVSLSLSLD